MSFYPRVSLVIVSRNRPAGLQRLLSALRFQSYRNLQVIVVSNTKVPVEGNATFIHYDKANISAARNIGIAASAGEFIAFCDDDAIPEPLWLERLIAPFHDAEVGSTGGFVRGRNGINYQWTSIKCNECGDDFPLAMKSSREMEKFAYDGEYFVKVQGTNCAFRKSALLKAGGFDENYRFFLDETDLSYCLAKTGWATVIVPLAEVQHGFEASAERTALRVPKTLKNIGASKAYFIHKHQSVGGKSSVTKFKELQRKRVLKFMVDGLMDPLDVRKLLGSLEDGLQETLPDSGQNIGGLGGATPAFLPFFVKTDRSEPKFIAFAGRLSQFRKLLAAAVDHQAKGFAVTVFRFSITALFHKRFYDSRGFWVQKGGLFGKSGRTAKPFQFWSIERRASSELADMAAQRDEAKLHIIR